MDRLKYFLLVFLLGVLLFLLYLSFSNKGNNIASLNDLVKCVNILECKGNGCKPVPKYCAPISSKKVSKAETNDSPGLKKLISNIVKPKEPEKVQTKKKAAVQPIQESEIKRAIKKKNITAEKKTRQAHEEHQYSKKRYKFKKLDLEFVERGFNYAMGNIFFALPLVAFGMSLWGIGFRPILQVYALLCLAAIIAAAFTGEIVIKNYNYLGPYLFILGGASLLLYEEQKSFVAPILGVIIGVFLGFMVASDGPLIDKWPFVIGTLMAAGFIILIFSIAMQLFNKPWLVTGTSIIGAGMIGLSLLMFAFELDSNR